MAHKVLVGGTSYDITKGRTLIGGTGYDITKGRNCVGGTGYDISFVKATFDEIIADTNIIDIAGRENSTAGNLSVGSWGAITQNETYYVFQFLNGYLTIVRADIEYRGAGVDVGVTTALIAQTGSVTYMPWCHANSDRFAASVSTDGVSATAVYGAVIAIIQFPSYPNSLVDKMLSSVTLTRLAGRNTSSTATVRAADDPTGRWFVAFRTGQIGLMSYNSPLGTVIFSNYNANPSLLRLSSPYQYCSSDGTTNANLRGGSIVAVTE